MGVNSKQVVMIKNIFVARQPPYSSDLSPCDFSFSQDWKIVRTHTIVRQSVNHE